MPGGTTTEAKLDAAPAAAKTDRPSAGLPNARFPSASLTSPGIPSAGVTDGSLTNGGLTSAGGADQWSSDREMNVSPRPALGAVRLIAPDRAWASSYVAALREGFARGTSAPLGEARIAQIELDFSGFLAGLVRQGGSMALASGATVPKVPFSIHWLVMGPVFVGELSFRHCLDDWLRQSGGHIGYGIRPSLRGRGFGRIILARGLDMARRRGLRRLLLTAHAGNTASRRVIEGQGGRLQDIVDDIFGHGPLCRYWIDLSAADAASP